MWPAALVHLLTALGVVCALMATRAVLSGTWEVAFAWLGLALLVDGIDGTFARLARVSEHLPRFSGERLDLIIDYLTYVFVPVLALLQAGYLQGGTGLLLAALILLSSLFHFSDLESKAADHRFIGFPAIWNLVAFYVFALDLSRISTGLVVGVCVILTFIPLKWVHPLRTVALRPVTLLAGVLGSAAAASVLWWGFPAGSWEKAVLLSTAAYALALTLYAGRAR
jgi:phosphatidylcholine synthase